ncbi:hypothetical protein CDD83_7864 [Cordyceps sp. RAO-2017]|nr:hypothetical protein CDD83_7864 [Cordyceps sp. RAO-2017]
MPGAVRTRRATGAPSAQLPSTAHVVALASLNLTRSASPPAPSSFLRLARTMAVSLSAPSLCLSQVKSQQERRRRLARREELLLRRHGREAEPQLPLSISRTRMATRRWRHWGKQRSNVWLRYLPTYREAGGRGGKIGA